MRTNVIRAKLVYEVEWVGAAHKYWFWTITNPVAGEVGAIDYGYSEELADAHDQATRSVTRHLALARWVKIREGL